MADQKITDLTADSTPTTDDLIVTVNDPTGTPANKKVTVANLRTILPVQTKVKVFTRDLTTASGDVSYTGVGFTPTGMMAIGAVNGSHSIGIGMVDSAKSAAQFGQYAANTFQPTSTEFIKIATSAGNVQGAIVKTYDADGFTLTWTKTGSPTGTADIYVLCFR